MATTPPLASLRMNSKVRGNPRKAMRPLLRMYTCRSNVGDVAPVVDSNPSSLPPVVVVVRNHSSRLNVVGLAIEVPHTTRPAAPSSTEVPGLLARPSAWLSVKAPA